MEDGRLRDIQRARLLDAMTQVACERGAANVTVAHVVQRAGVSRRTFYELFVDGQECVLAALEDALERAAARALPAWQASGSWPERVRGTLFALLSLFDEQPLLARLLVVESLSAGRVALERRARTLDELIDAIDSGRDEARASAEPTRLTAECVVGAVLAVIHARICEAEPPPLVELTNALMSTIVLPYRGPGAARRELRRPLPAHASVQRQDSPPSSDPFKDAGLRLTYRTMRVLAATAESPHASNRVIGERAGITDQGQVSKLLGRLLRIGLVSNSGRGPHQGAPNAWSLTARGEQMLQAISPHADERDGQDRQAFGPVGGGATANDRRTQREGTSK